MRTKTRLAAILCVGVMGGSIQAEGDGFSIHSMSRSQTAVVAAGIDETNLAQGIPVESDSNVVVGDRAYATDGDYGTHWYSYQGMNSDIQFVVDLGEVIPIGRLVAHVNQTETYVIETSDNQLLWTVRHTGARPYEDSHGQAAAITNEPNGSYSARYVRYTGSNTRNAYVGITEFAVFGLDEQALPETIGSVNLARGRPLFPLSNVVVGDPAYATDGLSTHWYSYQGADSYVQFVIDLGEPLSIGRLIAYANQTQTYTVETSIDNAHWSERHAGSRPYEDSHGQAVAITNDPAGAYAARYIRYTGANSMNAYAGITEFEIYGMTPVQPPPTLGDTNMAREAPVTPYSNQVVGEPSNVNDGDFGTLWYSYQGPNNIIQFVLDLGGLYPIGKMVFWANQTQTYLIETSPDNSVWTERHSGARPYDESHGQPVAFTNDPNGAYTARYVRYTGANSMTAYVGVTECEIYPMVPAATRPATRLLIACVGTPGRLYSLQRRARADAGIWRDVLGQVDLPGVAGGCVLRDVCSYAAHLYRIVERTSP